ncbi:type II toxin-antitoxin system RelE/ParE family toxin [Chryseobacterium indoltheticum]|uniref:Plasmid stabilisation system protein n=1 Tax=Chryseobacterium indoltheticum TaxID=254 RepID=A0A381FDW3_9FLAO|nr:type II toxin-antitoxin system RelE/ParE family toxin [Chryseobacterium indoltheticum]AZA73919.1 type II toxin-antitoxin system RelE/ParE family toxin [Chryseobacterium indoltheticum]SIR19367.1 Plasmid stabilization system protein ParE [Chryseobacterium indoltheticum]SUX44302.1 Plasmid stabilisation system protein [Chryseobacterium indoltheticum]
MKIVWTDFAIRNLKSIFEYHVEKANRKIAHKIKQKILTSAKQLISNPESGQLEFYLESLNQNHRYILEGNYKIIYRIVESNIVINDIFDVRQNPIKMIDEKRKIDS